MCDLDTEHDNDEFVKGGGKLSRRQFGKMSVIAGFTTALPSVVNAAEAKESDVTIETTMIDPISAAKFTDGYIIIQCDVISETHFAFTLTQDGDIDVPEKDLKKRILELDLTKPDGEKWTCYEIENFHTLFNASATPFNKSYLAISSFGEGFETKYGELLKKHDELSRYQNNNGLLRGTISKMKVYDNLVLACTSSRQVITYDGLSWTRLGNEIEEHETKWRFSSFRDFDLFSLDDVYAGGKAGDLWHYDGDEWRQIDFPSNSIISSICCGQDGYVYIFVMGHAIYKGRNDSWELIHEEESGFVFEDAVWYEDKVWYTNGYKIWTLENDTLEMMEDGSLFRVLQFFQYLAVRDGVLLVAGNHRAAFKKDGKWNVITD